MSIEQKINKILDSNIREIPYEGLEIDKISIIEEIKSLIEEIKTELK